MSTPHANEQLPEGKKQTGAAMEAGNALRGQTSFSHAPWQPPTLPFHPIGPDVPEVLATLRHEFFIPLAVIKGYTSTLLSQRHRLAPEEQDEFLQMIQQAERRLEELAEQLLEIAQLEAGIIRLDHSLVDICALARQAITQVEFQVPEPLRGQFTFVLRCRDALGDPMPDPPLIKGDVQRLQQLVQHLLENAVQYSPTGGRIDVIVQPASQAGSAEGLGQAADGSFLEICVCDVGMGIPEGDLERIFAPFYRVDTGLTRERYGLGLGLTACKHLVSLHQGRLWAETCPDGGSAFHVWLPIVNADS
jgi:signal transduction histidine kinase